MDMNENGKYTFCPNCGAKIKEGSKFCGECGEKIEINVTSNESAPQSIEDVLAGISDDAEKFDNLEEASLDTQESGENVESFSETTEEETVAQVPVVESKEKPKKVKRGVPVWGCLLISLVSVVLSVALTLGVLFYWNLPISGNSIIGNIISKYTPSGDNTNVGGQTVPAGSDVTINITGDSSNNAAAVYAKCSQSVVGIGVLANTSTTPWKDATMEFVGQGSGVVYTEDGYIITNHHVVDSAIDTSTGKFASGYEVRVYFDQSLSINFAATLIGYDETADLALLKIEVNGLTPIEFADSDNVALGDECFAIGSPGGLDFINSISNGIISGIDRNISTDTGYAYDLIQTTTAINPGNSGGALLDREGKLIGICELKIVSDGYEGMGFAITSNTTKKICESLKTIGTYVRPALGLTVNTQYTQTAATDAGLPAGPWVVSVTPGSAAANAGVTANMIITKFNGKAITDYFGLRKELQKCEVGDTIEIEVYDFSKASDKKSGTYRTLTIKLQVLTE